MAPLLRLTLLAVAVWLTTSDAPAQAPSKVPLSGSVRDVYRRDGYLEGAFVTITSHRTGLEISLVTDLAGRFWVAGLDPGTYTISISRPGYGNLVDSNFCIVAGQPARFDARLGPDRGDTPPLASAPPGVMIVHDPPSTSPVDVMSVSDIRAAMAFGKASAPLEAHPLVAGRWLTRRTVGRLFTPFWRVATMAQVAAASHRQFTEQEVPSPYIETLAWIVGYPQEYYLNDEGQSPQYLIAVRDIVIQPKGGTPRQDIKPTWKMHLTTQCDIERLESMLGPQFSRPGIVAAFPTDVIRPGNAIVFIYSRFGDARGNFGSIKVKEAVRRVVVRESDARKWK